MNKETFCWILESALLSFDEVTEDQIINEYKIEPDLTKIGIKLCKYLKKINL